MPPGGQYTYDGRSWNTVRPRPARPVHYCRLRRTQRRPDTANGLPAALTDWSGSHEGDKSHAGSGRNEPGKSCTPCGRWPNKSPHGWYSGAYRRTGRSARGHHIQDDLLPYTSPAHAPCSIAHHTRRKAHCRLSNWRDRAGTHLSRQAQHRTRDNGAASSFLRPVSGSRKCCPGGPLASAASSSSPGLVRAIPGAGPGAG
jgi:hypothetical protein